MLFEASGRGGIVVQLAFGTTSTGFSNLSGNNCPKLILGPRSEV